MNKIIIFFVGVVVLGLVVVGLSSSTKPKDVEVMVKDNTEDGAVIDKEVMLKDDVTKTDSTADKDDTMTKAGSYEVYSPEKLAKATTGDVVLFFRAGWCPTCRAVDSDIKANLLKIPENLTILDVNYDNSSALKQKYGVTYQHTFVQVDKDGNMIKKWSGSPTLSALVLEVK